MDTEIVGIPISEGTYTHLCRMIKGISRKYNGWGGMLAEDIEMELWVKSLEVIKQCQCVNLNIIARSCYNRAIDLYRQTKSKYADNAFPIDHRTLDYKDSFDAKVRSSQTNTSVDYVLSNSFNSDYSSAVVYDIIDLFPVSSKEHQYLMLVAQYTDSLTEPNRENYIRDNLGSCRIEKEFALRLGYKDDTSSGYRKLKTKVQKAILRYQRHGGSFTRYHI